MSINFKSFEIKEEPTNCPTPMQFRVGRNPSYIDSLLAGVVSPIIHLPQILWFGSFWPFLKSLWRGVSFICFSMAMGFLGRAQGVRIVEATPRELTMEDRQKVLDDMLAGSGFKAVPLNQLYGNQSHGGSGEH